jgi:phage nucleotide-binding protein
MAVSLRRTSGAAASSVKLLVYGQAGAGKTTLIKTLPNPVILSAEAGLLSLRDVDIPFVEIRTIDDLREAYAWLTLSDEAKGFASVAVDSISEIAEVVLSDKKATSKDPRAAYGEMQDVMGGLIRAFRDIPDRHVYVAAKCAKQSDEQGRLLYSPSMPGQQLPQALPYYFDEVLALRVERDAEGATHRALLCDSDGLWQAKDRSGALDTWEAPDLGAIIAKIQAGPRRVAEVPHE